MSSVTVTDNATGNSTDPEASAEARKRYYADAKLDDIDQVEVRTDGAEKPADGENDEPTAVTAAGAEPEIKILAPKQPSLLDLWGEARPVQRAATTSSASSMASSWKNFSPFAPSISVVAWKGG